MCLSSFLWSTRVYLLYIWIWQAIDRKCADPQDRQILKMPLGYLVSHIEARK